MQTTTLSAPDIVCDGCANAISRALSSLTGVLHIAVDIRAKTVTVTHAENVARETLVAALDRIGFPVAA